MRVPHGYPRFSDEEKTARLEAVGEFFAALGVKADEGRIRAVCNATAWIPWEYRGRRYFAGALQHAVRTKADGYQTAPQPGEIWKSFLTLCPSRLWDYDATQGTLPPRFYRKLLRRQRLLPDWAEQKALASGAKFPTEAVNALCEVFPGSEVISHQSVREVSTSGTEEAEKTV